MTLSALPILVKPRPTELLRPLLHLPMGKPAMIRVNFPSIELDRAVEKGDTIGLHLRPLPLAPDRRAHLVQHSLDSYAPLLCSGLETAEGSRALI